MRLLHFAESVATMDFFVSGVPLFAVHTMLHCSEVYSHTLKPFQFIPPALTNIHVQCIIFSREFNKGHSGEVYVCYDDKTPQNLVEIAFRLAMSS